MSDSATSTRPPRAIARDRARVRWHWKWWLYILHRWIGIVTCLLFAIWFVSGLVMIYVPFPSLGQAERLSGLPAIAFDQVRLGPDGASRASRTAFPQAMTLEMRADLPVWRVRTWQGEEIVLSARDGRIQGKVGREEAKRIASAFGHRPVAAIDSVVRDQWTVPGSFNRHRPLWKASLAGPGGHVLYVSSTNGAVVLDTDAHERFWNWLGSVPHWIYPTVLRQDNAAWRQVVMWVSGPCIIGAVTGMWIGILRVRLGRRRFKGGRTIPYHGWFAWHHVAGLFGGVALLAWIFSGWLSVDPFRLFASAEITTDQEMAFAQPGVVPAPDIGALAARASGARRITIHWSAGHPLLTVEAPGRAQVLDAASLAPARLDRAELIAAARHLLPGAPLRSVELLTRADAYWYAVGTFPPLPVLRLRFDDGARTWLHVDPRTGEFLGALDTRRRIYRWAFDFLHKWDLNGLTLHRPVWDILLWALSLLGIVTSITGIWIGWKRLVRKPVPSTRA